VPPATLQARKQQLVRDAIWDAAIDLFTQKGFDQTSVDEIAEAAGVSRRSFFRYFSSKSDLMTEGIGAYGLTLAAIIDACPPTATLAEVFRQTVVKVAEHTAAQPRTRQVMRIAAQYPAAREAQVARIAELQDRVAEAFERRCRHTAEPALTAGLLAGLTLSVLGATFKAWFQREEHDIAATAQRAFAALEGLVCGGGPKRRASTSPSRRRR